MVEQECSQVSLEEVIERAKRIELVPELLRRAHADAEWRDAVEHGLASGTLLGHPLSGGSQARDIWRRSLLREQFLDEIWDDPETFTAFVETCKAGSLLETDATTDGESEVVDADGDDSVPAETADSADVADAADRIDTADTADAVYAQLISALCDIVESWRADEADDDLGEPPTAASEGPGLDGLREKLERTELDLKATNAALAESRKHLKQAHSELRVRASEVSRKDRKAAELRGQLKQAETQLAESRTEMASLRADRDEYRRSAKKLQAQVESLQAGQQTTESRTAEESRRLKESIDDLGARLTAAQDVQAAVDLRILALEAELGEERERRESFEAILGALGIGDLAGTAASLRATLATLTQFQEGIGRYLSAQEDRERQARAMREEAEIKSREAEAARDHQREVERAWRDREYSRLAERENALFPDGQIDHIIIDGHNLVHRVFRPEDEARTRPWLEEVVARMAERLEEWGWDSRIHLVFDTHSASSSRTAGHGVTVYFHNNTREGGADAKIGQLISEGYLDATYMVVSTDRRHVWSDSLERMQSEGMNVDLVQVELLAKYLAALDEFGG